MAQGTQNKSGKNWNWKGGDLTRKIHVGMLKNMHRACNKGKNIVVQSFPAPTMLGTRGGGPPAVRTGHLRRNVNYEVKSLGELKILGRVGTGVGNAESVGYAVWLEYGTRPSPGRYVPAIGKRVNNGMHPGIAPRPFLRPLINHKAKREEIEKELGRRIF